MGYKVKFGREKKDTANLRAFGFYSTVYRMAGKMRTLAVVVGRTWRRVRANYGSFSDDDLQTVGLFESVQNGFMSGTDSQRSFEEIWEMDLCVHFHCG